MLTTCRRTMMTAAAVSATSMLPVMHLAGSEITYPEPACYALLKFYNDQRRVFGQVNAECPVGFPIGHSAPFGNWGVVSNYGHASNGTQFAGWKGVWYKKQWNSCTVGHYRPPDCRYYNASGCRTQAAYPDNERIYSATRWAMGLSDWTCRRAAGHVITISGLFMRLHELDWPDDSELVTVLRYPDVNVRMECRTSSSCSGRSNWYSPRARDSAVSANIRVVIDAR